MQVHCPLEAPTSYLGGFHAFFEMEDIAQMPSIFGLLVHSLEGCKKIFEKSF